jgi:shikimate kinase
MGGSGRNIVLTGFMGTGKTTVGRLLAARLDREFVDTDQLIEERHGPILQIFAEHGERRFRQIESELAAELARRSGLVVSSGGRMLVDGGNADLLESTGDVVALTAEVDTIVRRVGGERAAASRPMLAGGDVRGRIVELLAERAAAYGRFRQVATDDRTPEEIAAEIEALVGLDGR